MAARALGGEGGLIDVARSVKGGAKSLKVMGLAGSSASFLACLLARETARQTLVVCPDEKEAQRVAEEVEFYIGALGLTARSFALPARDPYRSLPGSSTTGRAAALAAMLEPEDGAPAIVAASIEAVLNSCPPPSAFFDGLLEVREGDALARDELTSALVKSGYTAVSAVMEPGDFSVRGGIVDVFAAGSSLPFRVELWDDEIESIRNFDPSSQKSTDKITRALVPPLKEVILTPGSTALARERIGDYARRVKEGLYGDLAEADLVKNLAELYGRLERRDHFPGIQGFLPAFYEESACALDYADDDAVVVYLEPFLCEQAIARRLEALEDEWRREIESGLMALPPRTHLVTRKKAEDALSGKAMVVSGVESEYLEKESAIEGGAAVGAPRPPRPEIEALPGISSDLSSLKVRPEEEDPLGPFIAALEDFGGLGIRTLLVSPMPAKAEHLAELLAGRGVHAPIHEEASPALADAPAMAVAVGALQRGFLDLAGKLAVIPEAEVFGEKIRKRRTSRLMESFIGDLSDLGEGDHVVHAEHGVGIYRGLVSLEVQWVGEWDFVNLRERPRIRMDSAKIEYAEGAGLYVPVHRVNQISKYRGPSETPPPLDALGGNAWEKLRRKVKKAVREFAEYLIRIHASRKLNKGFAFPPPDAAFREFEENFEFEETPDQMRAIDDVIKDMVKPESMDRVVCGDVGYGKTEVALRAAFLAAMSGRQVAVLVPTTILAQQHHDTFARRLKSYPLQVRSLSRFLGPAQRKKVVEELSEGKADVVIGTHRLLSKDVRFRDLGLLIIDEEHRFGVKHKERLREIRSAVDTLTLTATPIPRTLYMSLSGIRDLSVIDTPPPDRLSVYTELIRADDRLIREALERELRRGGQAFFVHNRVRTIEAAAGLVRSLVPTAKVLVAHGQMKEGELEKIMREFVGRRADVLVCSAIIESGLDIPTVNTMVVDRADTFGLAQLYQLRGRVGRGKERGYCYLMVPSRGSMTKEAAQRLKVLKEFSELGSGFKVAAHDLEIRGAGNLLGAEQSGHMTKIGVELYMNLLEEEIARLKGEAVETQIEPEINLPVPSYLSEEYVPDQKERLSWYKRLSRSRSLDEVASLRDELRDRYGSLPGEAENLIEVARLKTALYQIRATELSYNGKALILGLSDDTTADVDVLIGMATQRPRACRLGPDNRFHYSLSAKSPGEVFEGARALLNEVMGRDRIF